MFKKLKNVCLPTAAAVCWLPLVTLLTSCGTQAPPSAASDPLTWPVRNAVWDRSVEQSFSKWIEQFGTARANGQCSKLADCLRTPAANSLYDSANDSQLDVYADCADVPMIMRAYFAFKKKLPFSMAIISGGPYTKGNKPTGEELSQTSYAAGKIKNLFVDISNTVQSGYFGTAPELEGTDTIPAAISRQSIQPGTVFYDPNGHVLMVYKVENDGTIRLIDGHPDNSLTVQRFGEKFARGGSTQGGGFRNWRLTEWKDERVVRKPISAHVGYFGGKTQYVSPDNWGGTGSYYKWVRQILANGSKVNVKSEYDDRLKQLCVDLKDRANSVQNAISAGINNKKIESIGWPRNIYGTDGEWESFSTPSRDARLKASIREIQNFVQESVANFGSANSEFDYAGLASQSAVAAYYLNSWNTSLAKSECQVNFTASNGSKQNVNLNTLSNRLFDLSFDPYHCVELRWGIKPGNSDFNNAECSQNGKLTWYNQEIGWRNRIDRNYEESTNIGGGDAQAPNINIPQLLSKLNNGTIPDPTPQPTPVPNPVTFPKYCKVTTTDGTANVRKGPGTSFDIVSVLNNGASVKATRVAEEKWYSVEFIIGGVKYGENVQNPAWISKGLLSCN
jgi:uncharacterized protein YgiM (DUF1202 family)